MRIKQYNHKRWMSFLMVVALVVTMFVPVSVFADDDTDGTISENAAVVPETDNTQDDSVIQDDAVEDIVEDTDIITEAEDDSETEVSEKKNAVMTGNGFEDAIPMTLSSTYEVNLTTERPELYYSFTPQETGYYLFESFDNDGDPYGYLYTADDYWEYVDKSDDYGGSNNFFISRKLREGETYYLVATTYEYADNENPHSANYSVHVVQDTFIVNSFNQYIYAAFGEEVILDPEAESDYELSYKWYLEDSEDVLSVESTYTIDHFEEEMVLYCDVTDGDTTKTVRFVVGYDDDDDYVTPGLYGECWYDGYLNGDQAFDMDLLGFNVYYRQYDEELGEWTYNENLQEDVDYQIAGILDKNETEVADPSTITPGRYYLKVAGLNDYENQEVLLSFGVYGNYSADLTLSAPATITLSAYADTVLSFTAPAAGTYTFYSELVDQGADPVVTIYADAALEESLAYDDDGDDGLNFRLTRTMTAGETIYLNVYPYDNDEDSEGKIKIYAITGGTTPYEADMAKVDAVSTQINALAATNALTLNNKSAVLAAQAAYNALTAAQKAKVDPSVKSKLDAAVLKINQLQTAANNAAAQKAAAQKLAAYNAAKTKAQALKVSKPKAKAKAKKKAKITWKSVSGATGYQVQYSLKKNFKKAKTVTVNGGGKKAATLKKLKAGKKYFVRIRPISSVTNTSGGKETVYGKWSKTLKLKAKS